MNYLKEGITEGEFSEKIMSHTLSGFPLGNDSFVRKVSIELEKDLTMKSRGRPFKKWASLFIVYLQIFLFRIMKTFKITTDIHMY